MSDLAFNAWVVVAHHAHKGGDGSVAGARNSRYMDVKRQRSIGDGGDGWN